MAKPDFTKGILTLKKKPKLGYQRINFEKKKYWKIWFGHFDCLEKNQPEKRSCLFFYILRTQKYPEMFPMPFYVPCPFVLKPLLTFNLNVQPESHV